MLDYSVGDPPKFLHKLKKVQVTLESGRPFRPYLITTYPQATYLSKSPDFRSSKSTSNAKIVVIDLATRLGFAFDLMHTDRTGPGRPNPILLTGAVQLDCFDHHRGSLEPACNTLIMKGYISVYNKWVSMSKLLYLSVMS
jgi:hypothetical protein